MDFVTVSFNKDKLQQKVAENIADSRKKQNPRVLF